VRFFPCSASGIQRLLHICCDYLAECDIVFNCKKTASLRFAKQLKQLFKPCVFLNDISVKHSEQAQYVGVLLHALLKVDNDTQRQMKSLYSAANNLRFNYAQRSTAFKNAVSYVLHSTVQYACQLWCSYTQSSSVKCFKVTYSNL